MRNPPARPLDQVVALSAPEKAQISQLASAAGVPVAHAMRVGAVLYLRWRTGDFDPSHQPVDQEGPAAA